MTQVVERQWLELVQRADEAGMAAFLDADEGGLSGYSWIRVRPATGGFARWLVRTGRAERDEYAGGISMASNHLVTPERVPSLPGPEVAQSVRRHEA